MHLCINVTLVKKKETGHIQPPALTLDPEPIYFYAKVFILTTVYVYAQILAVGHELFFFGLGLAGLTDGGKS